MEIKKQRVERGQFWWKFVFFNRNCKRMTRLIECLRVLFLFFNGFGGVLLFSRKNNDNGGVAVAEERERERIVRQSHCDGAAETPPRASVSQLVLVLYNINVLP